MRGEERPRPLPQERQRDVDTLTRTIDDMIPQMALRRRQAEPALQTVAEATAAEPARREVTPPVVAPGGRPGAEEVETFLQHVLDGRGDLIDATIVRLRGQGCSVETLFLELLKPAARRVGELWCDDRVDFALTTVALGRLQRVMRELSPAFAAERSASPQAYRALFAQAPGEQHSFGLSMLAEFFRRAGWDVVGGVGGAVTDPVERVRREWIDLIGFSIGSEPHLRRQLDLVAGIRQTSLNPKIVVMMGGPLFVEQPELFESAHIDAAANDAIEALALAERLVVERQADR